MNHRFLAWILAAVFLLGACSRKQNLSVNTRLENYLALQLAAQLYLYKDMHAKDASMESYFMALEQQLQDNIARALYLIHDSQPSPAGAYQLTHMLERAKKVFKEHPLRIVWLHAGKPFAFPDDPILPSEYLARDAFEDHFGTQCIEISRRTPNE